MYLIIGYALTLLICINFPIFHYSAHDTQMQLKEQKDLNNNTVPILIYGWPHSGTTITNKIIQNLDNVCGYVHRETKQVTHTELRLAISHGCTHFVVKWPWDMTDEIRNSMKTNQ